MVQRLDSLYPFPGSVSIREQDFQPNLFTTVRPLEQYKFEPKPPPPQWVYPKEVDYLPEVAEVGEGSGEDAIGGSISDSSATSASAPAEVLSAGVVVAVGSVEPQGRAATFDDDDDPVEEIQWTQAKLKVAHKIWLDTQQWEKNSETPQILAELDELSENLPTLHLRTYSTAERPRRNTGTRRFVQNCESWMFFADVDHAVWIDARGYPDMSKRCKLQKEVTRRVLIPSVELHLCTIEQLKDQQETLAELKRYAECHRDGEYCAMEEPNPSDDDGEFSMSDADMSWDESSHEVSGDTSTDDEEIVDGSPHELSDDDERANESTSSDDL